MSMKSEAHLTGALVFPIPPGHCGGPAGNRRTVLDAEILGKLPLKGIDHGPRGAM